MESCCKDRSGGAQWSGVGYLATEKIVGGIEDQSALKPLESQLEIVRMHILYQSKMSH